MLATGPLYVTVLPPMFTTPFVKLNAAAVLLNVRLPLIVSALVALPFIVSAVVLLASVRLPFIVSAAPAPEGVQLDDRNVCAPPFSVMLPRLPAVLPPIFNMLVAVPDRLPFVFVVTVPFMFSVKPAATFNTPLFMFSNPVVVAVAPSAAMFAELPSLIVKLT
jgi:hypothetical protein